MTLTRRFAAIAAVLTLCIGNVAVCAGWQTTPEARTACCQDEAACPMHKSDSHGSGVRHPVTQTQADDCCASSERGHSATTNSTFVLSGMGPFAPAIVPLIAPSNVPALQGWRAFVPLPDAPVPKHLLFSVLLV